MKTSKGFYLCINPTYINGNLTAPIFLTYGTFLNCKQSLYKYYIKFKNKFHIISDYISDTNEEPRTYFNIECLYLDTTGSSLTGDTISFTVEIYQEKDYIQLKNNHKMEFISTDMNSLHSYFYNSISKEVI